LPSSGANSTAVGELHAGRERFNADGPRLAAGGRRRRGGAAEEAVEAVEGEIGESGEFRIQSSETRTQNCRTGPATDTRTDGSLRERRAANLRARSWSRTVLSASFRVCVAMCAGTRSRPARCLTAAMTSLTI